ncbi:uncharacterized protein NDAI_0G04110 [Naumovozyma dairenensis CBS 421]|uniref:Peptidase S54 rhomboid domain-containing protein n=1 Tax=Naumovozyma dairenensis (strain ATCC 10597 / BCRC 20456 / CBS 421 / NBRC 0211 / NRRL Y-12639) TaxID=1071378 RepID=J7S4D6_NAUDC|nr:hypothetical protein NDAI_0G04110 [Naumovozyma dairenensis CBS 421]CCK73396.1 hypothetical protein NDAI_0G04110 [Naumovozyma dairenensis CBS 421]
MRYSSDFIEVNIPRSLLRINEIPTATRILLLAYIFNTSCLFYIRNSTYYSLLASDASLKYSEVICPFLQLVPEKLAEYPLSIVFSNFVDTELWKILVNLVNIIIGGTFIEKNWNSSREVLIFTIVIGSITNISVVLCTFLFSQFFSGLNMKVPIDGNYTIIVGFPIIYKQLLPETTILNIKSPKIIAKNFRFKLLPIFTLCLLTGMQLIWFHHIAQLLSIWVTFFSCWIYLRFFQTLPFNENTIIGDASDTFQLIYFFPDIIKPVLKPIFDSVYNILCVKLKVIKPFEVIDIDKGNDIASQRGAKKIDATVEDRRRELALMVLQERIV